MRIFLLILSLIAAAACVFLNVLGYNATLSQIEYILVNTAVEILLCLLLGHFVYRTYANHKRAKKLDQALTNAKAALQVKDEDTHKAEKQPEKAAAPAKAAAAPQASAADTVAQPPLASDTTQPLDDTPADPDATTLFKAPFKG